MTKLSNLSNSLYKNIDYKNKLINVHKNSKKINIDYKNINHISSNLKR